jgi:hypothetical protein
MFVTVKAVSFTVIHYPPPISNKEHKNNMSTAAMPQWNNAPITSVMEENIATFLYLNSLVYIMPTTFP